ncbi:MAG: DUF2809 domain-containing protein [Sarcina sp.]
MKFKLNYKYLIGFIILLFVEIFIALFIRDAFIRPYIGDILVVVLLYTFIRSFIVKIRFLPIYIFLFASLVEVLQYFNIVKILGFQDNIFMRILIGSTFDIKDILCYLVGAILLIIYEKIVSDKYINGV